jgi:hypothetical protein
MRLQSEAEKLLNLLESRPDIRILAATLVILSSGGG